MKSTLKKQLFAVFAALVLLLIPAGAQAQQLNSNTTVGITLNVTVQESLTISATPSSVTFNGASGTVSASAPIVVTTNWVLNPATRSKVTLYAYFTQQNALTGTGTGHFIQANQISVTNGTACNVVDGAFSSFSCVGTGFQLASSSSSASVWPQGTNTQNLNLQINLGSAGVTPIDTYTGTLNIAAQAI